MTQQSESPVKLTVSLTRFVFSFLFHKEYRTETTNSRMDISTDLEILQHRTCKTSYYRDISTDLEMLSLSD